MALAKVGYALRILFFFLEVSFGVELRHLEEEQTAHTCQSLENLGKKITHSRT
jgi:hypothetical protein